MSATTGAVNYTANLPAPGVPMVDLATGLVSPAWFQWFLSIYARTGSAPGVGVAGVAAEAAASLSIANAATVGLTAEVAARTAADALLAPKHDPVLTTATSTATFLPGQSVNVFAQSGDTGHAADLVWNSANFGNHLTTDNSALAISSRVIGSGTPGPAAADYGMTISVIKDSWPTSNAMGEIDGLTIITRQGADDTAGILVNVGCVSGFSAVLEGQSYQFAPISGATLAGCDVQIAGLETGTTGGASYIGYVFTATAGTWTGLQLQAQTPAVMGVFMNCLNAAGTAVFQVEGDGSVSSAATYNGTGYKVSTVPVVGPRNTGWTAGTGATPNKAAMNYGTATLAQLAARVMALEQALFAATGHGLIGP